MKNNIDLLNFFSKKEIEDMARKSGFVSRLSPITGFSFLLTCTVGHINTPDATLAQLVAFLNSSCKVDVSPQALDERINEKAKDFLKMCFLRALNLSTKKIEIPNDLISHFSHIYIIDSTNFELHPSLKDKFKGSGGSASEAAMRIQFIYDYLSGNMHIVIGDVKTTDQQTLNDIVKNNKIDTTGISLFLQDLGYFDIDTFTRINNTLDDNFISKYKSKVKIYDSTGKEINLLNILKKNPDKIDLQIIIRDLKCRLVGEKLSDNLINQRLRRANEEASKKGRKITAYTRLLLSYGLFITNLSEKYSTKSVFTLYRLRWQIELVFKIWKSILNIHKIHSERNNRVWCEVYGKLIVAILISRIINFITFKSKESFSYFRVFKYINTIALNWASAIVLGASYVIKFLNKISKQIIKLCKKNKQKNKPTIEVLLLNLKPSLKNLEA